MKYVIKVRAQAQNKVLLAHEIVEVGNKYLSYNKYVRELIVGDSFCYNGAWYDIEAIKQIVSRSTCLV
jgi:hypothetical protein